MLKPSRGGHRIKTLPAWLFGALIVLAAFVSGAVVLTRWLDGHTGRAWFGSTVVPTCVGEECRSSDAGLVIEDAQVLVAPPPVTTGVPVAPIVIAAPEDAGLVEEPRAIADSGQRSDAAATQLLVQGPMAFVAPPRTLASAQSPAPELDASRSAAPDDAGAPRADRAEEQHPGVRCGSATCPEGQVCCNASCSQCRPPGVSCSQVLCGPISPMSVPCGNNTCNVGEVCCNVSCGICTQPGGTCSQQRCDGVQVPVSTPCGPNTCNVGQVCCNASCGICTNPGETCPREPCP